MIHYNYLPRMSLFFRNITIQPVVHLVMSLLVLVGNLSCFIMSEGLHTKEGFYAFCFFIVGLVLSSNILIEMRNRYESPSLR